MDQTEPPVAVSGSEVQQAPDWTIDANNSARHSSARWDGDNGAGLRPAPVQPAKADAPALVHNINASPAAHESGIASPPASLLFWTRFDPSVCQTEHGFALPDCARPTANSAARPALFFSTVAVAPLAVPAGGSAGGVPPSPSVPLTLTIGRWMNDPGAEARWLEHHLARQAAEQKRQQEHRENLNRVLYQLLLGGQGEAGG